MKRKRRRGAGDWFICVLHYNTFPTGSRIEYSLSHTSAGCTGNCSKHSSRSASSDTFEEVYLLIGLAWGAVVELVRHQDGDAAEESWNGSLGLDWDRINWIDPHRIWCREWPGVLSHSIYTYLIWNVWSQSGQNWRKWSTLVCSVGRDSFFIKSEERSLTPTNLLSSPLLSTLSNTVLSSKARNTNIGPTLVEFLWEAKTKNQIKISTYNPYYVLMMLLLKLTDWYFGTPCRTEADTGKFSNNWVSQSQGALPFTILQK